jgi:hypothetical protein
MGRYDSLIWSEFYYTALIGYCFCCILIEKKKNEDAIVGLLTTGGIWVLYLIRLFFVDQIFYAWIRFAFGCLVGFCGFFYLIYIVICLIHKQKI